MSDLISREKAIDAFVKYVADGYAESPNDFEGYMEIVKKLPSAQSQYKNGKWIDDIVSYSDTGDIILANCSLCGYQMDIVYEHGYFRYCPSCGARMDGESDD